MKRREKWIIFILLLVTPFILRPMLGNFFSHDIEDVRKRIKEHLYEKYGEEFVVDRIGTRSYSDKTYYEARIYPKSIVGTPKENDDYYYAQAGVRKKPFGRLGGVGAGYENVKLNIETEEYLQPKVKKIFGERVKMKPDVKYEWSGEEVDHYSRKIKSGFKDLLNKVNANPDKHRLKLDLEIYVFNRIEDEQEKEKRREDIFKFVQYLKKEGLYEYLEMRVVFVDERVLAPSYDKFERKIKYSDKVKVEIEEEDTTVELPPEELRERVSEKLQEEVEEMSEEELLDSMKEIGKDELVYDDHKGIRKWNSQYRALIYSEGMIKERYTSSYEDDPNALRDYEEIDDVKIGTYLEYIYVN